MTDRDAKNRRLCEWLGFLKPTKDETEEALRDWRYELRRWTLHRTSGAPIENFSSYYWTPPDFYTSEDASALLLEKMRRPLMVSDWPGCEGWRVEIGVKSPQTGSFYAGTLKGGELLGPTCKDRKEAIAEAALKLIDSQPSEVRE